MNHYCIIIEEETVLANEYRKKFSNRMFLDELILYRIVTLNDLE